VEASPVCTPGGAGQRATQVARMCGGRRCSSGAYASVGSRIDILRPVGAGEGYVTVPDVHPGGDRLPHSSGWPRVLQAIEVAEALRIDPADVAPDCWRHVHCRLCASDRPQPYARTRHQHLPAADGHETGVAYELDHSGRPLPLWQGCRVIGPG
jgi:Protein of unknown function (DUF2840)